MRRRENGSSSVLPMKLAVFAPADWAGRDSSERYGEWMTARRAWADARDIIEIPGDAEAWTAYPDAIFRPEDL